MDTGDGNHLSGRLLRDERRRFAELVVARIGGPAEPIESLVHILAACIEFSSPLLLNDYIRWASTFPDKESPFPCDVSGILAELDGVFQDHLGGIVGAIARDYVDVARQQLNELGPPVSVTPPVRPHATLQKTYLSFLLASRRREALDLILEAVHSGVEVESIYLDVLQPVQHELGRLWQAGRISVAQEHYCTAATQFVMSQLQPYFLGNGSTGRTIVAACVGDELHEVGLRIVSDLFEVNGWNAVYLGANTPAGSIAEAVAQHGADVLAASTTMPQHLFGVAEVLRTVRLHPQCGHVKSLVGGYPFSVDPLLWRKVGADAGAPTAREALRVADRFARPREASVPSEVELGEAAVQPLEIPTTPANAGNDDLSRVNNSLVTLQRKLHKANVELVALNKANKKKAEALERADRRKNEFLAVLGHELRGPLAPLRFAVDLLKMEDDDPEILREVRDTIERQLHQMEHLINDLLDASRIAHGKIELQRDRLELSVIIERAIEMAEPLIEEKKVALVVRLAETPIAVEGDLVRLTQVVANLLTNAAKYNDEGGTIWISTAEQGGHAVVEVRDNGIGIEAEMLEDVFSTFAQEQRSRRHARGGLGLGLSLVKSLVELHGGQIHVASNGAGTGSQFTVTLPIIQAAEPREPMPTADRGGLTTAGPPQSRRVLIVEDTPGTARLIASLFEKLGHRPEVSLDGASAIRQFREHRPEIVVLDLVLPDMSGFEVTREIRRLDGGKETLVVALTGYGDTTHRIQASESGCDEYLVKPIDVQALQELTTHPKLGAPRRPVR